MSGGVGEIKAIGAKNPTSIDIPPKTSVGQDRYLSESPMKKA